MTTILSGEFWAFVGVVAGIYTIFALGVQVQFGFTGLLNFGQVGFMAIGAYTMAILTVKTDVGMWPAALIAVGAAILAGLLLGLPTLRLRADYFAITTIAFSEIVRYVALNEDRLWAARRGRSTSRARAPRLSTTRPGSASRAAFRTGSTGSKDVTMLVIVWAAALVLLLLLHVALRSPWGRVLRSIRRTRTPPPPLARTSSPTSSSRWRSGPRSAAWRGSSTPGSSPSSAPTTSRRSTFFAYTIVILGGTARLWAVPLGRSSSGSSSPARASSTSRRSATSTRPTAPTSASP